MKEYGYVRVSSLDQNEERQLFEMKIYEISFLLKIRVYL